MLRNLAILDLFSTFASEIRNNKFNILKDRRLDL